MNALARRASQADNIEGNQHNVFELEVPGDRFAGEGRDLKSSFVRELDVEHTAVASTRSLGVLAHQVVECTRVWQYSSDDGGCLLSFELD